MLNNTILKVIRLNSVWTCGLLRSTFKMKIECLVNKDGR